jgi:hypothetical protein
MVQLEPWQLPEWLRRILVCGVSAVFRCDWPNKTKTNTSNVCLYKLLLLYDDRLGILYRSSLCAGRDAGITLILGNSHCEDIEALLGSSCYIASIARVRVNETHFLRAFDPVHFAHRRLGEGFVAKSAKHSQHTNAALVLAGLVQAE